MAEQAVSRGSNHATGDATPAGGVQREVWRAVAIALASAVAGLTLGSLVLYVVVLRRRTGK